MAAPKTDNARGATDAKIELRRNVLATVPMPRVFDAFSGLGKMYLAAWKDAVEYVGCDEREWSPNEPHSRYVATNQLIMRCIDLQRFNVFDFDAYGCPWEQMLILLHRRKWSTGEVGAVVLTDGSSLKLRWGSMSTAASKLLGGDRDNLPRSDAGTDGLQRILIKRWCALAKVKPRHCWRAEGRGSGAGGARMAYTALVFEGQPVAKSGS